ncbi:MAG TPA: flavin reductase family protein [Thermomicrobiales bacterium]|jgi:flavin reductase (DIM6/NTAB) family NADH-FMN oxidoreductase RutF
MDEAAKKQVLRLFSYGLYAVTAREGEHAAAMTVNWVTQVSFAPPLIAVSMERESRAGAMVIRTGVFALCVFAAEQRELAGLLGRHSAKVPDKFAAVAWSPGGATGCPLIAETLGALECRVTKTMQAGDSILILADVIEAHTLRDGDPLTMQAAGFKHAG